MRSALFLLLLAVQVTAGERKERDFDWYRVTQPADISEEDARRLGGQIQFLVRLRKELDAALVDARVLTAKQVAAPTKQTQPWSIRYHHTRSDLEGATGEGYGINTQGTGFYNGEPSFLAIVPTRDEERMRSTLLDMGTRQILFKRIGFRYSRVPTARGAPFAFGIVTFFRWSFLPDVGYPTALGAVTKGSLEKAQKWTADGTFPTTRKLFESTQSELERKPNFYDQRLAIGSILLMEFLWEDSKKSRRALLNLLAEYGKRSSAPGTVPRYDYDRFLKRFKGVFGSEKSIEQKFRQHVLKRSAGLNKKKWDARQKR